MQGVSEASPKANPKLLWRKKVVGMAKSGPVIYNDKIVVAGDGELVCLSKKGDVLWQVKSDNGFEASPTIHNNVVYIGDLDGKLSAYELSTGTEKWSYTTEGQISGAVNIYENAGKTYALIGSYDYFLHCVDAATGKLLWKYESDNYVNGTAAIYNGKAYFGGCDGHVHIVDIASGKPVNKIEVATYVAGTVAMVNNPAYVGDYDGQVSAVDVSKGEVVWQWTNQSNSLPFIASPSVIKNYVVIGSRDKHLYCFNSKDGTLKWKYNSGSRIDASTIIYDNKVLAVNMRGDIFVLDMETGKPVWQYETGSPTTGNPALTKNNMAILADNGTMFFFECK